MPSASMRLQYCEWRKAYQSSAFLLTLRLVEQDGKPHIGFDGKAILTMVVPRGTTFEAKHKLMQSYWRNLGEKVLCPLGKGRVSTLP